MQQKTLKRKPILLSVCALLECQENSRQKTLIFLFNFMSQQGNPNSLILPSSSIVFANRKAAVSGERTPQFVFFQEKPRISDCKGTATGTCAALSFRFAEKPRGLSKFGGVLVPPLRATPNQVLAYTPRSTVPPQ